MTDTDTQDDYTPNPPDHTGTNAPSADYDDCHTSGAISARYKSIFAERITDDLDYAERLRVTHELQEDMRRAYVRMVGRPTRGTGTKRAPAAPVVLQPDEGDDGALVITCQGACGETKSFKKFPTRSGGRPGREAVCRACRDAVRQNGS